MSKKIVSFIFFIIIGAAILYSAYFLFGDYFWSWKIGRDYQKFEQGFEKYLREDKYGGATPEETYKMFVDALRQGDVDSAGKYFYWEYQEREKERFAKMKDEGRLEEYVNSLPEWGELREEEYGVSGSKQFILVKYNDHESIVRAPDGRGGFVEATSTPGEYAALIIIFELNKRASIWKVYSL